MDRAAITQFTYGPFERISEIIDSKGNVTSVQFDQLGRRISLNLPRVITTSKGVTTFDYDADGTRVRKTSPDKTTISVAGLYERRQSAAGTVHVFYVQGEMGVVAQVNYSEHAGGEERLFF